MTEPKKDEMMRSDQVADLDPYNQRGKPKQEAARELLGDEPEVEEDENFDGPKFTQEQKVKLRDYGAEIFTLHGESINSLKEKGLKVWSNLDSSDFQLGYEGHKTEVAIRLASNYLFLPDSNNKNYDEQANMVTNYSLELERKIPGIYASLGFPSDYAEIVLHCLTKRGLELFKGTTPNGGYMYTSTAMSRSESLGSGKTDSFFISVGGMDEYGLGIHAFSATEDISFIFATPLIFPDSNRVNL
ncbi:MAG: hypothetical protein A3B38_02460 [Candidatus Levybacteria bacterium RIFCSPLOWO2_01_FULL_36_13]|nr:MAG: hypothetical protein A2684_03655 [Candidatus Levybacteria bacterium RIFCSPHIGHO2_01_FULL_36_15b]OGH35147.1 MAG: hypothetical protein A3B38_02460 [Candidatus Levybacteria bacterium RIFCSPLOWO2_01_FULL_36_13]